MIMCLFILYLIRKLPTWRPPHLSEVSHKRWSGQNLALEKGGKVRKLDYCFFNREKIDTFAMLGGQKCV